MRSYVNRIGETVRISKEHLEVSVKIKNELQMLSPNMRCNWKTHEKMMIQEGYNDSCYCEAYRCLIKNYQSKNGIINKKEKHVDLVADKKLSSIKSAVGELYYNKREIQLESQKLGKLKRELTLHSLIAEEISDAVNDYLSDFSFPKFIYKDKVKSGSTMVVLISDWHIGAVVENVHGNSYNYKIAKERVGLYFEKVVNIAKENNVSDIKVVCLGDMTEHVSMRKVNQAFESEFTMSEQVVKAFDLIKNFVFNLSYNFNVTYQGVGGNHDRMNGDKNDNIDGDSSIHVINYFLKELIDTANSEKSSRLKYEECDEINYSSVISINGVNLKFVHGDNEKRGYTTLSSHSALDDVLYNVVAMGHIHHFDVNEVGLNRFEMHCGSIMGMNNYASRAKFASKASQAVILVDKNGEIDIRRVGVQS